MICPRQTETAGLRGRDYTVEEESGEQQSETLLTTDGAVIEGLQVMNHRFAGVFELPCISAWARPVRASYNENMFKMAHMRREDAQDYRESTHAASVAIWNGNFVQK